MGLRAGMQIPLSLPKPQPPGSPVRQQWRDFCGFLLSGSCWLHYDAIWFPLHQFPLTTSSCLCDALRALPPTLGGWSARVTVTWFVTTTPLFCERAGTANKPNHPFSPAMLPARRNTCFCVQVCVSLPRAGCWAGGVGKAVVYSSRDVFWPGVFKLAFKNMGCKYYESAKPY